MTKQINTFKKSVADALKARAEAADNDANPGLAKKLMHEQKCLTTDTIATYFADEGLNFSFFSDAAIYMIQKARKIAQAAVGAGRLDPYTTAILQNAQDLANEGCVMTPKLVQAALTADIEVDDSPNVVKMKHRQNYAIGTARSQANTSRQAMLNMGMAKIENVEGRRCLSVDFEHPVVKKALGTE